MHSNLNDIGLDALIVEVWDPPMMALATTSPEKEKKVKEGNSMAPSLVEACKRYGRKKGGQ